MNAQNDFEKKTNAEVVDINVLATNTEFSFLEHNYWQNFAKCRNSVLTSERLHWKKLSPSLLTKPVYSKR